MLEVVVGHEPLNLLEDLHLTGIAEVTRLGLQYSLNCVLFILENIAQHVRILIKLLEKIAKNGLRAQLQTSRGLPLLEYYLDDFLQQSLMMLVWMLVCVQDGVLS